MYYFVKFDSTGEVDFITISDDKTESETENAYYVSEEECMRLKKQIAAKIEAENKAEEDFFISYDYLLSKTAELEKENAALLFQMLTGEEYADV